MTASTDSINGHADAERRDWDWETDGTLDHVYIETRLVHIRNGPSAGQTKPVLDFHGGGGDEIVTVWPPTVLRRMLRQELERRGKPDFEPGERIKVTPTGKRSGPNGQYWDFDEPEFEFAAPKPSAAALLGDEVGDVFGDEQTELALEAERDARDALHAPLGLLPDD